MSPRGLQPSKPNAEVSDGSWVYGPSGSARAAALVYASIVWLGMWWLTRSAADFSSLFFPQLPRIWSLGPWVQGYVALLFLVLGLLAVLAPLFSAWLAWSIWSSQVRLDDRGLAIRVRGRWSLTTWDSLAGVRMKEGEERYSFKWICRSLRDRKTAFILGFVGNRGSLLTDIVARSRRPPPEVPKTLSFRAGAVVRCSIRFDARRIRIKHPLKRSNITCWSEVKKLRIHRFARNRGDFSRLVLQLPGRTIVLSIVAEDLHGSRNWYGVRGGTAPSSELIARFLQQVTPAEKIVEVDVSSSPQTLEEWHERYRALKESEVATNLYGLFGLIVVIGLGWFRGFGREWTWEFDGVLLCVVLFLIASIVVRFGQVGRERRLLATGSDRDWVSEPLVGSSVP